jgi:spore coat polysaccharide biosynthesis protein SpsF (cytidylyltransferase family)
MNAGIIVCSRLSSERLPRKILKEINGLPVLIHLTKRLLLSNISVIFAVPYDEIHLYQDIFLKHKLFDKIKVYPSLHINDPLARMNEIAGFTKLDYIVRVTHDKIFVDIDEMINALDIAQKTKADYLYLPNMIPGTGFEIISKSCLEKAADKFKMVEFISYAAKLVSNNSIRVHPKESFLSTEFNLLIDFPEDLLFHKVIMSKFNYDARIKDIVKFIEDNKELAYINKVPKITIYTCAYNASQFVDKLFESIENQSVFKMHNCEYLFIDDCSSDDTFIKASKFSTKFSNVLIFRNDKNIGLSSSSNFALKNSRGNYIIRIDADDFFVNQNTIDDMLNFAIENKLEAVYPDNYFGTFKKIQKGNECHHVGGTLFNKRSINFIKFTDGLRNYEGLDLFHRAKDKLKIGYFKRPAFFYTQHENSMSKTNLEERKLTREMIEKGWLDV